MVKSWSLDQSWVHYILTLNVRVRSEMRKPDYFICGLHGALLPQNSKLWSLESASSPVFPQHLPIKVLVSRSALVQ